MGAIPQRIVGFGRALNGPRTAARGGGRSGGVIAPMPHRPDLAARLDCAAPPPTRPSTGEPHVADKQAPAAIDPSWKPLLDDEFAADYMGELRDYLAERKRRGAVVFPHSSHWFNAFALTPLESVRVVILGQDPYHGPGQAHGLSFSVPEGVPPPPSLVNIFKEIDAEFPDEPRRLSGRGRGDLAGWARQGVFLLNSVLTVERGEAASHQGRGWETFTDAVVTKLSREREHLVFMLWGSYAQKKGQVIDDARHLVLRSPHPSPLSARRGFFGNGHFAAANAYLVEHGREPIDWFDVA